MQLANEDPRNAGRKRLNTNADMKNYADFSADICDGCPPPTASCEDTATATLTTAQKLLTIVGVNYDGGYVPFSAPVLATNAAGIEKELDAVISTKETNVSNYVRYDATSSKLLVSHIGEGAVASLKFSDNTTIPLMRKCSYKTVCESKASAVGTVTPFTYKGTDTTLAPAPWSATPATATATAGTLQAAIIAALPTTFTVVVTPNTTTSMYDISITGETAFAGSIGGSVFANCGCAGKFV